MQQQYADSTARPAATPVQSPQHASYASPIERELPMLAGIGAFVTWCEDLLNILSGPVITAGLVIALVALLTDGDLLVKIPAMTYIWAVSMALGVDAQFVGSAAKAARAIRQRRPWAAFGYFVLCGALGYVGYIASNVFATQEAQGITMAQALQHLGMDGSMWIFQRSFLAVVLVFLSGFLRYVAPGKNVAQSTTEEKERLQAELELEPLRAQLRQQKVRDLRAAALTAVGRDGQPQQAVRPHIVTASATLPPAAPPVEHTAQAYKAMHDWDDIPDEVEGDADPNETTYIPTVSRPRDPRMGQVYDEALAPNESLASASYDSGDFDPFDEAEEDDYPTNSAHQRKKAKSAKGRSNQRQVKAALAVNTQSDRERQRAIRQAVWAVADRIEASGVGFPSEEKLVIEVNKHLKTQGSEVRTSRTAVRSWMKGWNNQRRHQQRQSDIEPIEPMEPQALRELVAQEAW